MSYFAGFIALLSFVIVSSPAYAGDRPPAENITKFLRPGIDYNLDREKKIKYPERSGYYKKEDEIKKMTRLIFSNGLELAVCAKHEKRTYDCDRVAEVYYCDALSYVIMSSLDDRNRGEGHFDMIQDRFDEVGEYFDELDQEGRIDIVDFGDFDMASFKEVAFYCRDFDTIYDPMLAMLRQREYAKLKKEER